MSEFKTPATEADFDKNFAQIKPLMTANQAHFESSRCLFCYDAPCVTACPTGIDIPLFIKQINSGNVNGAARTIYKSNYFGHACGKVCPTEVLCEGSCVYNHQGVPAIEIGRLQSFATEKAIRESMPIANLSGKTAGKVAIVGAGPAGISCACELRSLGLDVDIFEAKALGSGLTVYGVAPYKITNEEALAEVEYLQKQFGFKIHYNHPIHSSQDIENLEIEYDAIFIGIGLGRTSSLGIAGEELQGLEGAVEFVEKLRMNKANEKVPARVIVLGAGNTAMDAASESARMGAEDVTLAYRRGKEAMGAYHFEYELAKSVGVKALFNAAPVRIIGNDKVEGVEFVRTKETKGKLESIAESEFIMPADLVIKATGQSKQREFLALIAGLQLDSKGNIITEADTFQTGNSKYYAAGDAVSGGQEVVNAVANGKRAAKAIAKSIAGQ